MKKFPTQFWIVALLLGWLFDFLFWKHAPGVSFAIYTSLTLLAGFVLLWLDGIRPSGRALLLLPFILFFALITFLRREPLTAFLAHGLTLFLMAGFVVTYRGGRWLEYSLADYFSRAVDLLSSAFVRAGSFAVEIGRIKRESASGEKKSGALWPVVRGILFAIPVLVFFAALLSSADLIFAQRLKVLTDLFNLENLPEYIFRVIYVFILAYVLAGVYLHASARSGDESLLGLEKPLVPRFFGFTETAIVLGSVVVLFGLFVSIQFQYFFGGQANIHVEGFTFSEYARRGFGELVAAAFFAMLLFLGLSTIARRESALQQKTFSTLGGLLVALVAVMLVSAYQRLILYETAYGFTRLRTYTHVFMVWVAVLLAAVVLLDVLQRQRTFALAALLAALGFAVSLSLLNVDAFIFQQNLRRFEQGQPLDAGYLASLSTDAIPRMVELVQSSSADSAARDQVGAALACFQMWQSQRTPDRSWQAFQLSDYRAALALGQAAQALKGYQLDTSTWPEKVTTPLGVQIECASSSAD